MAITTASPSPSMEVPPEPGSASYRQWHAFTREVFGRMYPLLRKRPDMVIGRVGETATLALSVFESTSVQHVGYVAELNDPNQAVSGATQTTLNRWRGSVALLTWGGEVTQSDLRSATVILGEHAEYVDLVSTRLPTDDNPLSVDLALGVTLGEGRVPFVDVEETALAIKCLQQQYGV